MNLQMQEIITFLKYDKFNAEKIFNRCSNITEQFTVPIEEFLGAFKAEEEIVEVSGEQPIEGEIIEGEAEIIEGEGEIVEGNQTLVEPVVGEEDQANIGVAADANIGITDEEGAQ